MTLNERLASYVKATDEDSAFISECLSESEALINVRIGKTEIPPPVKDRAILEVAADLFHRRRARNGVVLFDTDAAEPFRISRDPMLAAREILAPYLIQGIS